MLDYRFSDCEFHDLEVGGQGQYFGKVDDQYACAQVCRDHDNCEAFLFVDEGFYSPAQVKDCFLRWKEDFSNPYYTHEKLIGGYKNCRNTYTTIESK